MKKLLTIMICALSMICLTVHAEPTVTTTGEAKEPIKVYIFTKDHCPYCEKAETYIKGLEADYGDYFDLVIYQVYDINFQIENKQYYNLMNTVAKLFKTEVSGVPYIVIGDEFDTNGFGDDTGDQVKEAILKAYNNENYKDVVAEELAKLPENPHANDGIIIGGILVAIVAVIGVIIYFGRKNK